MPADCERARTASASFNRTFASLATGLHLLEAERSTDFGVASGFVAAALSVVVHDGPIVWVTQRHCAGEGGTVYGPGLWSLGIDPERVLLVAARSSQDVLWSVEQAVSASCVGAVVGEVHGGRAVDLTATRRIALRSERSGVPVCLVTAGCDVGPTSARTRWRVAAAPSAASSPEPTFLGQPTFSLDIVKNRSGPCETRRVAYCPQDGRFADVEPIARRAVGQVETVPRRADADSRYPHAPAHARPGVVTLEHVSSYRGRFDEKKHAQAIESGAICSHQCGYALVQSALEQFSNDRTRSFESQIARQHESGAISRPPTVYGQRASALETLRRRLDKGDKR